MKRYTADWLIGQVDAIDKLSRSIAKTVKIHSKEAAAELDAVQYACNRAHETIRKQAAQAGKDE